MNCKMDQVWLWFQKCPCDYQIPWGPLNFWTISWYHRDYQMPEKLPNALKQLSNGQVVKWKHFPRFWPFVRGIQRSLVNSPHKGQWRGALTFLLICVWINGWVNNSEAGDLRRCRAHYDGGGGGGGGDGGAFKRVLRIMKMNAQTNRINIPD